MQRFCNIETGGKNKREVCTVLYKRENLKSIPLHFAVEGTAVDTQQLGGFRFIATSCLQGLDDLPAAGHEEMDMLDTLPDAGFDSRLSCQIRMSENLNGMVFRIRGDEQ